MSHRHRQLLRRVNGQRRMDRAARRVLWTPLMRTVIGTALTMMMGGCILGAMRRRVFR